MRGRPITLEEFDRLIEAVKQSDRGTQWIWDVKALFLSGLRISEAHRLRWDKGDIVIDLESREYVFLAQKNNQQERLPIVRDFVDHLETIPKRQRRGYVFGFEGIRQSSRLTLDQTKRAISSFGKDAGIKTDDGKTCTAHDLRRSFGLKWALKVNAPVLQKLMRHKSITTTMDFYAQIETRDIHGYLEQLHEQEEEKLQSDA